MQIAPLLLPLMPGWAQGAGADEAGRASGAQFADGQGRVTPLDIDPAVLELLRRELAAPPASGGLPRVQTLRLDCTSITRLRDSLRHAPAPRQQPVQPVREPSAQGATAGDAAHQRAKSAATLEDLGRRFGCARAQ